MFDLDRFVEDCRNAGGGAEPQRAVRELVARAVSEPARVLKALGEPDHAGIRTLYASPDLTILDIVWAPMMTVMPHDHRMWAVIGVYGGREDNIFWRRIPGDPEGRVEAAGARSLSTGDVEPLGHGIIHSVTNPIPKLSGAIQIYGGDFFAAERSEWDAETLREGRYDPERALRRFGEAEAAFGRR
jgi:predicted metal-dependent enzyme (double-stranded beta helix superfamily)